MASTRSILRQPRRLPKPSSSSSAPSTRKRLPNEIKQRRTYFHATSPSRALATAISPNNRYYDGGEGFKWNGYAATSAVVVLAAAVVSENQQKKTYPQCDALLSSPSRLDGPSPPPSSSSSSSSSPNNPKNSAPKNVMLHRMRSLQARDMGDKYKVDWKNVLGEGAYGSVHPARSKGTGEKVALKKISKRFTDSSSFLTETDALLRIYDNGGHPNISGLRDMYEDYGHFYLVMDLVGGGEMFDHLIHYGAYSEADAARLMQDVASALAFLHGVGVVHADLKPENLLLCSKSRQDGTIKVIDFGCAVVSEDICEMYGEDEEEEEVFSEEDGKLKKKGEDFSSSKSKGGGASTGTTAYWPPERFMKNFIVSPSTDMWSAGIILFIMLTGVHPFDIEGTSSDDEIKARITSNPSPHFIIQNNPELTAHLSPSAMDLICKLMEPDPVKRLTADEMMNHPWIRGVTAHTSKMMDSAKKLSRFQDLRDKLEAEIFAVLVDHGNKDSTMSEANHSHLKTGRILGKREEDAPTSILKRAFEIFDNEGKGFVSKDDIKRVLPELSSQDQKDMIEATDYEQDEFTEGLTLTDFGKLFVGLNHIHFPRGHVIFNAGEAGDAMYFINSGRVEIKTKKGHLVSILRHGDFFGEGSLLDEDNTRFTTARCGTPVDVIKIDKKDFERYIAKSTEAKNKLKLKWKARTLSYAKNLIWLQTNVKTREFKKGDVVYNEGDVGKSMYMVDEQEGGELEVKHGNNVVHSYEGGESFGESSLLFNRLRSSTVTCSSKTCKLHEMQGSDFLALLESSPETAASLRNMCRKRMFKKAVKAFAMDNNKSNKKSLFGKGLFQSKVSPSGLSNDDIVRAFHEADKDGSGTLSYVEVRDLMHLMDPAFPETEIELLLKFIDVDEDGGINLEEFKRLFRSFEDAAFTNRR